MRAFLSLFITALISTVSASLLYPRQIPGYPACAQGCLANATSSKCQPGEVQCLCEDTAFVNETSTCFAGSCNGTDLQAADKAARDNCALAGVTLTSSGTSSATASSSTSSSKSNSAESTMVNLMGGAAALGLAVLAL
ncbi:hypothetical protein V8E52_009166 [Russula decolorans]